MSTIPSRYIPSSFSTFPVNGKKPLVKWEEYQSRHATAEEKSKWDHDFPGGPISLGIACGRVSKLFVLDVDGPEGQASLSTRTLPKTPTVKTPRADGGRHHYFQWVPELDGRVTTRAAVLPGLDVRGEGGFVAFYGWELSPLAVPFAKPPQWLIQALPLKELSPLQALAKVPMEGPEGSKSWFIDKLAGMKEGNRNETFTALAGSLRARDYKPDEIFAILLPSAREKNFPEGELKTICDSVGRYSPRIQASEPDDDSLETFMADRKPVKWLCEQVFAEGSIAFFAGLPKTQKSWLLLDFAIEAARGGKWLGKYPVKKLKVVYMDQERPKVEGQRRIAALLKAKGLSIADLNGNFIFRRSSIKIDIQASFEAFRKYLADKRPDLIIIDSFATSHTREESNRMEIQFVLEKVKELREEFGCAFVFIHHNTKYSRQARREGEPPSILDMAGNVAIPAVAEHVFGVEPQDLKNSLVYHLANNMGEILPTMATRIVDLDLEKSAIIVEAR